MSAQTPNSNAADSIDLTEVVDVDDSGKPPMPEARITIDLDRHPDPETDGWIAYDPADIGSLVGTGDTAPAAATDYCKKIEEHHNEQLAQKQEGGDDG